MYIIIGVGLLLGCGERKEYVDVLQRAIATADEHPDSALVMLDSLARHEVDFGKHFLMQYRLHRLNVYNKLDTVFKTTEEAQHLADYFEDNGTSNEKMLAYYLLGRTYYDTHEAPMALKYFRTAAEKADTTAADCNYRQLSRVYGQMGNLFYEQNLMSNSLTCRDRAVAYAWQAKDTISVLANLSSRIAALSKIVDADSIIELTLSTSKQAMSLGYDNVSAGILVFAIRRLVEKGDFVAAKSCMDLYESKSGFFNSSNDIQKGREIYYYTKGFYYMEKGMLDSAKYYFYKELHDGKDFNNQNAASRGLSFLYNRIDIPDSVAKYAMYSYEMNDSVYSNMATKEVEQVRALYNYMRNQEIAREEKERADKEASKLSVAIFTIVFLVIIVALVAIAVYKRRMKERKRYRDSLSALAKTQTELLTLRSYKIEHEKEFSQLIKRKEDELARLNSDIEVYKERIGNQRESAESKLQESAVYKNIQKSAKKALFLTDDDWHQVYMMVIDVLPQFYKFISARRLELNDKEFKTCILIRLHFTPKEVANMLDVSSPYITKMRNQMMQKLFGVEGKSKELDEKLMEYS